MIALQPTEHYAFVQAVIPLVMMAAQIGKGIADNAKAKKEQRAADAMANAIPKVDPGMQGQLDALRMKQRYAETGRSRIANLKREMAQDANAQTQNNLIRGAGTSPGALQQGMLRSENQTQQALMQAGAESEQIAPQYMQMQSPLISDIADRTLSLQTYMRDSAQFRAAQRQQNGNNAITGAMGLANSIETDENGKLVWNPKKKTVDDSVDFGQSLLDILKRRKAQPANGDD